MSTTERDQLIQLFQRYDRDGDGSITAEELRGTLRELHGAEPSDDAVNGMIAALDDDGNGTIELEEFLAAVNVYLAPPKRDA